MIIMLEHKKGIIALNLLAIRAKQTKTTTQYLFYCFCVSLLPSTKEDDDPIFEWDG